jgi:hypothetical protein
MGESGLGVIRRNATSRYGRAGVRGLDSNHPLHGRIVLCRLDALQGKRDRRPTHKSG